MKHAKTLEDCVAISRTWMLLQHSNILLLKALIYKSTGSWYIAKCEDGIFRNCRIKGKLKLDRYITSTNPIAVGDHVIVELESNPEDTAMIAAIETRSNYLVRTSPHSKFQKHIVASNLTQSIILATLKDPKTSLGFIDRFLVTCEAYHIPAIIVINKSDTLDEIDKMYYEEIYSIYTKIGYPVHLISAEKKINMDTLHHLLKDKITLMTGHSGVGKSTLINQLIPAQDIRVQEVSDWSGKGMHTTTFAQMYDLPQGGQLIDTPGIRELGIVDINRAELSGYFPEMKRILQACKYNNCNHFNTPHCAVKQAVMDGIISQERYISYAKIFESIDEKSY